MKRIALIAVICAFVSLFGVSTAKADMWDVTGISNIDIIYEGNPYFHITNLVQAGTSITGGSLVHPGWPKDIDSGSVIGNAIEMVAHYRDYPSAILTLDGTIALDGSMSGTWLDTWGGLDRTGTWASTSGNAVLVPVPGAVLLGMLGLSIAGVKLRKHA